jgi:hypothetical protein
MCPANASSFIVARPFGWLANGHNPVRDARLRVLSAAPDRLRKLADA